MKTLFTIAISLISFSLLAQVESDTTYWKANGNISLNFSEVSFTNWAAGGESSVSGVGLFNLSANYEKDIVLWENSFKFNYGLLKKGNNKLAKSEDIIDINSKFDVKTKSDKLFYSAMFNFRSQFANGYNYPDTNTKISGFLAPAYITAGLGIDYKSSEKLSLSALPASSKITIVNDDALSTTGAFGVEPGSKSRAEFGATVKAQFKAPVVENVNIDTQISLFSNYLDTPQNIDIVWDFAVNMKINDFLSANFLSNLIYDDDIKTAADDDGNGNIDSEGPRIQFKQLLGIGLSYNF